MKLATLCYVREGGRTLMIHRVKKENDIHKGKWNGLGGKFEPGESPEDCVIREVREESGLLIDKPVLKGFLSFPNFAHNEDWYAFVFIVNNYEGHIIDPQEGYLRWIPDDELLKLSLWEGDLIFLPWLDRPGFFSAKFTYQHGRLLNHEVTFYPS